MIDQKTKEVFLALKIMLIHPENENRFLQEGLVKINVNIISPSPFYRAML